jgi:hypothetical protein
MSDPTSSGISSDFSARVWSKLHDVRPDDVLVHILPCPFIGVKDGRGGLYVPRI